MENWIKKELDNISGKFENYEEDKKAYEMVRPAMVRVITKALNTDEGFHKLLLSLDKDNIAALADLTNDALWIGYVMARLQIRDNSTSGELKL